MDAGKLLEIDHRVKVTVDIDDANSRLLDEIITPRWQIPL
jgi:hypothetical protein